MLEHPEADTGEAPARARYDCRSLERLREIDPSGAFMRRWIRMFLSEAPQHLAEMEAASAAGIPRPVARAAHSLKSYVGWLGSQSLWRLCDRLEQEAQAGAVAECRRLLPDLRRQLRRFEDWLASYLASQP